MTRRAEKAGAMVGEIERLGGRAVLAPAIEIVDPDSWDACDAAVERLARYDVLLLTSAAAAEHFLDRCDAREVRRSAFTGLTIAAVGARTAGMVRERGLEVAVVPDQAGGGALGAALAAGGVAGRRVLFPCGDHALGEAEQQLRAAGAVVDRVVVYRTLGPHRAAADDLRLVLSGGVDAVTFASPSAVRNVEELLGEEGFAQLKGRVVLAAIGPTTAAALAGAGAPADVVAEDSTGEGLVRSLAAFFQEHP